MSLGAITEYPTGLVSTSPTILYISTTDTYATVTATGYLNPAKVLGTTFGNDQMALVYTTDDGPVFLKVVITGTPGSYNYSLVEPTSPGDVTLPTITNHLIVSTNTTGTLANLSGTAINNGSIQAGLSGTAGTLISYSGTASKGSLVVQAVANTGNTITTIANAAMGQASVISIPDPANAIARFLVGATATPFTSGNLPQASGTAGLMIDSGIAGSSLAVSNLPQVATVSFTAANIAGMYATPVQILASPGSGKINVIDSIQWDYAYLTAAYTAGGLITAQYGNTNHAGGVVCTLGIAATALTGLSASGQLYDVATSFGGANSVVENAAIYMSNATQAFASGSGTVTLYIRYRTITPA